MNKIKGLVAVAMVSVMTGSALFAASNAKTNGRKDSFNNFEKKNASIERIEKKPEVKIQTITGKIKITDGGFVTIKEKGQGGKRYILTTENIFFAPEKEVSSKIKDKNDKDNKDKFKNEKYSFERVSMNSIKKQDGKSITIEGCLNEESGVFTVLRLSGSGKNSADRPGTAK